MADVQMKRFITILVLFVSSFAFAQSTATIQQYKINATGTTWKNSQLDSCMEMYGLQPVSYTRIGMYASQVPTPNTYEVAWLLSGSSCLIYFHAPGSNFGATTYAITTAANNAALPCPASGTSQTRNFTMGYSNSPNDGTDLTGLTIPSSNPQCVSGSGAACTGTPGAIKNVWASTEPNAQGLYRISADFEVTFSGASCTQSNTEKAVSDAAATPATCPGTYGTVNGKPVCLPSSLATRNTVAAIAGQPAKAGNPPAGSSGDLPYSGRTPAAGTNGNDGSTAKATDGKSVGTVGAGVPPTLGATGASSSSGAPADALTDCDKKPNSVGCSEYGSVTSETLATTNSGFNSIGSVSLATAAGCPSSESFSVAGHQFAVSFTPICNGADSYIKPVVIVLGAALAAFVFIGGFKA